MGILEYEYEGVTFYFIDNESYFWGDRPYGDWYYDLEKFSFFCKAALSSLPVIGPSRMSSTATTGRRDLSRCISRTNFTAASSSGISSPS